MKREYENYYLIFEIHEQVEATGIAAGGIS